MILLLLIGIGLVLYLFIGLLLLAWIDYDYELSHFIAEWPVPALELVLLFGWPVLFSVYCWCRRAVVIEGQEACLDAAESPDLPM